MNKYNIGTAGDPYVTKALNAFLNTDVKKARFGHYCVDGHELYFRNVVGSSRFGAKLQQNLVAVRLQDGTVIGNSSVLPLIGRKVSFGRERENRDQTEIQARLSSLVTMIPFTVFEQAELDINSFKMIDRGPEETIKRKGKEVYDKKTNKYITPIETVHFTGASLFKVDGSVFLFDIDRRELQHKIFNPFLVKLVDTHVKTIAKAYDSLKPTEVKRAEAKGLEVKRQGEFFFIPVNTSNLKPDLAVQDNNWNGVKKGQPIRIELRAGENRPNYAAEGIQELSYVRGKVTHSGREHAALMLKTWHKAVANTSMASFTITGDVD